MFRETVLSTHWIESWVDFTIGVDTTKESYPSCNLVTILSSHSSYLQMETNFMCYVL